MSEPSSPKDAPRSGRRLAVKIAAAAVFGSFVIFMAGFFTANYPSLCGSSCHATYPEYKTWSKSSHSSVACDSCHADPSYVGPPVGRFFSAMRRYIVYRLDIYGRPLNPESDYAQNRVTAARCISCHPLDKQKFKETSGLNAGRPMHKKHTDAGLLCTVCHNRITHLGAETAEPIKSWAPGFKYQNFMTMRYGCKRCHISGTKFRNAQWTPPRRAGLFWSLYRPYKDSGLKQWEKIMARSKKIPSSCPFCHNSEFKLPEGHERADWRTSHGIASEHEYRECLTCHGPGKKYDNNGKSWCTVCHEEESLKTKF